MKKISSLFKKKNKTPKATQCTMTAPMGITSDEYYAIRSSLCNAYNDAASRRRPGSTKQSGCMRGIEKAIAIFDSVQPHTMEV